MISMDSFLTLLVIFKLIKIIWYYSYYFFAYFTIFTDFLTASFTQGSKSLYDVKVCSAILLFMYLYIEGRCFNASKPCCNNEVFNVHARANAG